MLSEFNFSCFGKPAHPASMFWLDCMLSVFLVTLVEIKLDSAGFGGKSGMENEVVNLLMGLIQFSFILE